MRKSVLLLASMALALVLVSGVALAATFYGTNGPDKIVGTEESDQIFGLGGNDDLEGRGGGDVIRAGPGSDTGSGEDGNDTIYLGPGNDGTGGCCEPIYYANAFEGGLGEDVMYGGDGADVMTGDRLLFQGSDTKGRADIMYGEGGNDLIDGDAGSNTLYGGDGNDVLGTNNRDYSEVWYGGAGDDWILRVGGGDRVAESDTFYGGIGDDYFDTVGAPSKGDIFYADDGNDRLAVGPVAGSGKHLIYCGSGYDTVWYFGSRQDNVTHDCEKVRRA